MEITVRPMKNDDYESVKRIYMQGIETKIATFQTEALTFEDWDKGHTRECRFVAVDEMNRVVGWVALSPTSSRCVYKGVAEVSIYISSDVRGKQVGTNLMNKLINESEKLGIWTLQAGIFELNVASLALHKKCGFRVVGVRDRIAQDTDGAWQNTVLMEKRSSVIGF